jgi:MFS family permease
MPVAAADRRRAGTLLRYLVITQFAVNVTSPYFTPYMLSHLGMSYAAFVGITAIALVARVAALPVLGVFAERHGAHRLLVLGAVGIVPLPALWIVSPSLLWLASVQIAAGFAWAAFELATLLLFFDALDEERRTVLLTRYNLANAAAIVVGALTGAFILHRLDASGAAYATIFAVSSAGRLAALGLLKRVPDLRPLHGLVPTRPIAVRPSLGVLERPILAALSRRRTEAPSRRSVPK